MKLYELAITPSAQRVNIFLAEKAISIPREEVNVREGANLTEAFQAISANGQIPVLELDDGTTICESVAICRYFEALYPEKTPLFGTTPLEQAEIEMWQRIVELKGLFILFQAFRNSSGIYKDRERCVPAWGEEARLRVLEFLPTLEKRTASSPFIGGANFSIADITAYIMINFLARLDHELDDTTPALREWHQRIAQRPAIQSLNA